MANDYSKDTIDMTWAAKGACKSEDPNLFYSDYLSATGRLDQQTAISICRRCDVRPQCLEYALIYERHGVWGGMTENQRQAFRRAKNLETRLDRFNLVSFLPRKQVHDNKLDPVRETDSDESNSFEFQ